MNLDELYRIYLDHPVVTTDSRKIEKGSIFFALKGDNFNGNNFAGQALDRGCSYAVVDEPDALTDKRCILTTNVLETLQKLANYHRRQFAIPVIAITGSNGKTTTKELIVCVLSEKYQLTATIGNLNNYIGVPLTLLAMKQSDQFAVVEMGASHLGEINFLCRIAEPTHGLITNIGKAHLEGFGSFEGVIKTKAELYLYLAEKKATVFKNADNPVLNALTAPENVIKYGMSDKYHYSARIISADPFVSIRWSNNGALCHDKELVTDSLIETMLPGRYNFENILAAISIGNHFGIESSSIKKAVENYKPQNNRSQIIHSGSNTILLDAYNANPSSTEAALQNLLHIKTENKMVILGDMLELGEYAEEEHRKIYNFLLSHSIPGILIGKMYKSIANNALYPSFDQVDDFLEWLPQHRIQSAFILVKGSRGIKLEKIKDWL
ncbi:MAG: UDP-N-acetylmuramoyl-tripeptide--D-alanyl-D-alanine ligase [Bacteroidia bacterium]|nr:UDP-N-acetylmuramoyl-tripeptide--D-alanyl-D-alanine ligase [Bacteroidia bacterium]